MNTPDNPIITRPNRKQFRAIARKANNSQDPEDSYNLGCCYHHGWGTHPDFAKAAACYDKAVAAGISAAENNLGLLYLGGRGVQQDTLKAMALFKKAADKGVSDAMLSLSTIFLLERYPEIPRNEEVGRSWLLKAAEAGHPSAMNNLGVAYVVGACGVLQDRDQAITWLKKAVDRGHDTAPQALMELLLS